MGNLFIHSPVDGYLGCFQFGVITDEVSMNIVQSMCGQMFSILLDDYLGTEWLDSIIGLYLTFEKLSNF